MTKSDLIPLLFFCAGAVYAAADPTQPPSVFSEPVAATGAEVENKARLQSVIIRPGKKSLALIDGITYGLGDMVGDLRLVKVTERSVILRGPQGREALFLTPEVEVTPADGKSAINRSDKP